MQLTVRGLGCRYGDDWVFRYLQLSLETSGTVAVVGPSGVGKTTLLSVLGGLLEPSEGTVLIDGRPPDPGAIGWIFQTTNAFSNRTVLSNLTAPLLLIGEDAADSQLRALDAARVVGLSHRLDTRARHLSGGELQRLAIARAIAGRPRLILADEPTGQLDATTTESVLDAMMTNRPSGTAVVVCTHDPLVAARCDLLLRLDYGRLVEAR